MQATKSCHQHQVVSEVLVRQKMKGQSKRLLLQGINYKKTQEAGKRFDILSADWGWEASAAEVKGWLSLNWLFDAHGKSIKQKGQGGVIFQMAGAAYPSLTI